MGRDSPPSNSDDVIDSRNVIERLEELEQERADLADAALEADNSDADNTLAAKRAALKEWDDDNGEELKALKELQEQAAGYSSDWRHGAQLIRDSYFREYAEAFAEEIGAINKDAKWPNDCIDWERAARELQMDYTSVEFDGVTYWLR